jgi:SAM-dependent MidA family methyltransferase
MRQCLTNPDGGYYTSRGQETSSDPFGKRGDFITSPEISQIFGELVGLWTYAEWKAQGITGKVNLIELGPGRGTLMDDMLRTLRNFKPMMGSVDKIWLVEASKNLREMQHKLLCGEAKLEECEEGYRSKCKYNASTEIVWCEDMKFVPSDADVAPFVIAHEFFDALPIHIFQSVAPKPESTSSTTTSTTTSPPAQVSPKEKPNEWREMLVNPVSPYDAILNARAKKAGPAPDFDLIIAQKPTPHSQMLPRMSERYQKLLSTTNANIEVSPESIALVADIAKRIGGAKGAPSKGAALILDYGPSQTIPANSLRGIQSHKPISPFALPGAVDISADVDFLGLAHSALNASPGVEVHGPVEQALFLSAMGIKERAEMLLTKAEQGKEGEEVRMRIMQSWRRLVDRGPDGMGKMYKALAILPYDPAKEVRRPVGFGGDVKV